MNAETKTSVVGYATVSGEKNIVETLREVHATPDSVVLVIAALERLGLAAADLEAAADEIAPEPGEAEDGASTATLSGPAAAFLDAHSTLTTADVDALADAARRRNTAVLTAQTARLLRDALSTAEVADRLGVDASTVRHRKSDGGLYALPTRSGGLRFPAWQFDDTSDPWQVLPGLREVLSALTGDRPEAALHPLVVSDFFTQPRHWLRLDDAPVSVRDWLLSGGDVARVLDGAATAFVLG